MPRYEQEPHARKEKKQLSERQRRLLEKRKRAQQKALRRKRRTVLAMTLVCVVGIGFTIYTLLNSVFAGSGGDLPKEIATPPELKKDVINFLVCGIDYEEGRNYGDKLGMTDVVLYVSFDTNSTRHLRWARSTYRGNW